MSTCRLLIGDVRETLSQIPDGSVQTVVTSPPYWGLRDYGTAEWEGGDPECDHRPRALKPDRNEDRQTFGDSYATHPTQLLSFGKRAACDKCGATKTDRQLGLDPTPEEYVANMVAVFREVRRVLRDDGTCWLNLGDSYSGYHGNSQVPDDEAPSNKPGYVENMRRSVVGVSGLKPKDLVGIPWRVAFALQADGWWLRSDIIWHKPNPMPESVTDRPTKAHEYLFLLTKSERYYYDADAIAEESTEAGTVNSFGNKRADARRVDELTGNMKPGVMYETKPTRNARSVWTITTKPYPGAHFATFPPELAERCILAGTSQRGACPECGAPWERVTEKVTRFEGNAAKAGATADDLNASGKWRNGGEKGNRSLKMGPVVSSGTTGWWPTCDCHRDGFHHCPTCDRTERTANLTDGCPACGETMIPAPHNPVPQIVLDPFGGSGTTAMVATGHGRRAILCELNPDYADLITERVGPMLMEAA